MKCPSCKKTLEKGTEICDNCNSKIDINYKWKIALIIITLYYSYIFLQFERENFEFAYINSSFSLFLTLALWLLSFSVSFCLLEKYKKSWKIKTVIIFGLLCALMFELILISSFPQIISNINFNSFFPVIWILIIGAILYIKKEKENSYYTELQKKEELKKLGILYIDIFIHSYGLPCTLNAETIIEFHNDYITFIASNDKNIKLPKEKINLLVGIGAKGMDVTV